jgi:hypothetical protein
MATADKNPRDDLPVHVNRLGEEPPDNLKESTSAEERFHMVRLLTERMWTINGRTAARYARSTIPVVVSARP